MNNSSSKETCNLARILLISTGNYVISHIDNKKNRLAYARSASRCQQLCSADSDLNLIKQELLTFRYNVGKQTTKKWLSREGEYYEMAVQHAIEVVDSVLLRFVNGYTGNDHISSNTLESDGYEICACLSGFGAHKR